MKDLQNKGHIKRWLYVTAGLLFLGIGAVGVFVPLLPTTPFLLLAAACFLHSSERLYSWLMNHRIFGNYIRNYREHRAMSLPSKVFILALLWITMSYAIFSVVKILIVQIVLLLIAIGVTIHIVALKTPPPDQV